MLESIYDGFDFLRRERAILCFMLGMMCYHNRHIKNLEQETMS